MKIIHPRRVTLKILLCWPKKIHAKEMLIKKFPPSITIFFGLSLFTSANWPNRLFKSLELSYMEPNIFN